MAGRLMCITAHPDDEVGAFGGALLMARDRGVCTSVVCLTEGAAGSYRKAGQSDTELAGERRAEFETACDALHVADRQLLSYPDGKLWQEPFLPLVQVLVTAIRRFRPHVVLTFGGDGGVNLHRDHTAISLAATAAFHWAGRSGVFPESGEDHAAWAPQKLYYSATDFFSSRDEEAVACGARTPASLRFELGKLHQEKVAAFALHTSQQGVLERVQAQFQDAFLTESYLLVAARRPVIEEADFWDGVELDTALSGCPLDR